VFLTINNGDMFNELCLMINRNFIIIIIIISHVQTVHLPTRLIRPSTCSLFQFIPVAAEAE